MLINTSFNMHEEPIVKSHQDAVKSFEESKLDFLFHTIKVIFSIINNICLKIKSA
jgi:predicted NodU family carbamoyl transferase